VLLLQAYDSHKTAQITYSSFSHGQNVYYCGIPAATKFYLYIPYKQKHAMAINNKQPTGDCEAQLT